MSATIFCAIILRHDAVLVCCVLPVIIVCLYQSRQCIHSRHTLKMVNRTRVADSSVKNVCVNVVYIKLIRRVSCNIRSVHNLHSITFSGIDNSLACVRKIHFIKLYSVSSVLESDQMAQLNIIAECLAQLSCCKVNRHHQSLPLRFGNRVSCCLPEITCKIEAAGVSVLELIEGCEVVGCHGSRLCTVRIDTEFVHSGIIDLYIIHINATLLRGFNHTYGKRTCTFRILLCHRSIVSCHRYGYSHDVVCLVRTCRCLTGSQLTAVRCEELSGGDITAEV